MTRTCESCGGEHAISLARCPHCHAHPASTAKAIALLGLLAASPGALAQEPPGPAVAVYGPPPSYDEPPVERPVNPNDLTPLEPSAMLGKLTDYEIRSLEEIIAQAETPQAKQAPSRLLMVNAFSLGDKDTWEGLIERHLNEVDATDPDLAYKYALHLSKKGPASTDAVLHWSGVALEHKDAWTGLTLSTRVYNLHKLRAKAALAGWEAARAADASESTDATRAAAERARERTAQMAQAWLDAAKLNAKDEGPPSELLDKAKAE